MKMSPKTQELREPLMYQTRSSIILALKRMAACCVLAAAVGIGSASADEASGVSSQVGPDLTLRTPPYLQNRSRTGIVVMAELESHQQLVVQYGSSSDYGRSVAMETVASGGGSYFYRGILSGLEPGATYHYRLALPDGTGVTGDATFRTAPAHWEDFSFAALGDTQTVNTVKAHEDRKYWEADPWEPGNSMFRDMVERGVAFFLGLGDHAQDGDNYQRTKQAYLDRMCAILGRHVPFYIAWGNHDGKSPEHPLRLAADMPSRFRTDGRSTSTPGFGSYAFEYSGVFFVCLDHFQSSARAADDPENDITNGWLDAVLDSPAARNARFRIVAVHVPPFCERWIDGSARLREHLVPRLERFEVHLCLSGHMHGYERGFLNGVHYVIAGNGSYLDCFEPLVHDWPHMVVGGQIDGRPHHVSGQYRRQSRPGVLGPAEPIQGGLFHGYAQVTVRDRCLRLDMHGFNADGSYIGILDSFEIDPSPCPLPTREREHGTAISLPILGDQQHGGDGFMLVKHEIDASLREGDGQSMADVDGDGNNNVIVGTGRGGQVFWYEKHSPTEWTRHLIADGFVEVEGTIAADFNNDGQIEVVILDQATADLSRPHVSIAKQDTEDPRKSWSVSVLDSHAPHVQQGIAVDITGNGLLDFVYAYEGKVDGEGGFYWMQNHGGNPLDPANWTKHEIGQMEGAWWIDRNSPKDFSGNGIGGDLLVGARAGGRAPRSARGGIFLYLRPEDPTRPWQKITVDDTFPTLQVASGDLTGNGDDRDVVAGACHDSQHTGLFIYEFHNGWNRIEVERDHNWWGTYAYDINQDGRAEIIAGEQTGHTLRIYAFDQDAGRYTLRASDRFRKPDDQILFDDITGDGRKTEFFVGADPGGVFWYQAFFS
jgi:hypothetical protein